MKTFNEKRLGYFGETYEMKVIKQLIGEKTAKGKKFRRDDAFGRKMLRKIAPQHFSNPHARDIIKYLKDYYTDKHKVAYYDTIESFIKTNKTQDLQVDILMEYLDKVQYVDDDDYETVQENSINFINTKNIYLAWKIFEEDCIQKGKYWEYRKYAQGITDAIVTMQDEDELEAMVEGDHSDLNEGERHTITTGIPTLDIDMNGGLALGELALVIAGLKVGKAQPNDCKVYTPNGFKLMGEIEVGDKVIGSDGRSQDVLGVFPQGEKDVYKVTFSDNTHTFCCKEHLWSVQDREDVRNNRGYKTMALEDIMKNLKLSSGQNNYRIPMVKPVQFKGSKLPIHPYIMGLMIGDGSMSNNFGISSGDKESLLKMSEYLGEDYKLIKINEFDYRIKYIKKSNLNPLKTEFKKIGLLGKKSISKFIPDEYLYASLEDRKELLRGLIDSDGHITKKGKLQYSCISFEIVDGLRTLILSLGGFCGKISSRYTSYIYEGEKKQGQLSYRINATFTKEIKIISYIKRKQDRYKPRVKKAKSKVIKDVELFTKNECTCIKVSNLDELYITDDFIVTHNTTMATVLAQNAAMLGYNVLQIFLEDTPEQIKMKHRAKLTGESLGTVGNKKNRKTIARLSDKQLKKMAKAGGTLVLHKMDSTNTTVDDIGKAIKKAKDRGVWFQDTKEFRKITFDVVLIDYVDCIKPKDKYDTDYGGDKEVLRDLEKLCSKKHGLNFACWGFTQGGRSSLNTTMVNVEDMGGSIKKAQIAHFICSIAKTLEQRAIGEATFAVLGSRIGRDGIIYKDCTFDNATMDIVFRKEANIQAITTNDAYAR